MFLCGLTIRANREAMALLLPGPASLAGLPSSFRGARVLVHDRLVVVVMRSRVCLVEGRDVQLYSTVQSLRWGHEHPEVKTRGP